MAIIAGDALSCRASPFSKQSAGQFGDLPLAERLNALQGSALHLPETLSLDSAKGLTTLWDPIIGVYLTHIQH